MNFRPYHFLIPGGFSLLAALLEGASVSLLVPLIRGLIGNDYAFALNTPVLKSILILFPTIASRPNASLFASLTLLIFIATVGHHLLCYMASLTVFNLIRTMTHKLRVMVYQRCLYFNKHFFDSLNPGQFHQIINGYTKQAAEKLSDLHDVIYMLMLIVIYFIVMLMISWQLTLIIAGAFPLLHLIVSRVINKISVTSQDYANSYSELGKRLSNVLSIIPLIKAHNAEETEIKEFTRISRLAEQLQFSIDKKALLLKPLQEIIMLSLVLFLIGIVAFFFLEQKPENAAAYMVFFFVLKRCVTYFGIFNRFRASLAGLTGPAEQIRMLISEQYHAKYQISSGTHRFHGLDKEIAFCGVSFGYPKKMHVLADLNLKIKAGKTTALLGSTGSGKTTIINLLLRYYDDYSGGILLDGVDIRTIDRTSLLDKIAVVGQTVDLFDATFGENLLYFINKEVSKHEILKALEKVSLLGLIQRLPLGLDTRVGDHGVQLSGGEKQRLGIARAILRNADILIFDEATSALDAETNEHIQNAIADASKGKTSIIVSHNFLNVKNADRIIYLENGRVHEEGSLAELLAHKNTFYEQWRRQFDE